MLDFFLLLEKLGIFSARDLFYYFPKRHEDRSNFTPIAELMPDSVISCSGEILDVKYKPIKRMPLVEILIGDDSGTIHAVWFNQPYLKNQFECGNKIVLFGKIENYRNRLQIQNPEFEVMSSDETSLHMGRITPIYPLTEGVFQRSLRSTVQDAIEKYLDTVLVDYMPETLKERYGLMSLREAIRAMHFPSSFDNQKEARKRLVYDEFLSFQLALFLKAKKTKEEQKSVAVTVDSNFIVDFEKKLPFKLTSSQKNALHEISNDIKKNTAMNRLLQGDVGSGKTVVAAYAFLLASFSKIQSAFLVPTEILAEQHFRTLKDLLALFGIKVALLTKSVDLDKRSRLLAELKQGKISVLIGTHAILQESVLFKELGLVIIDEQHKFGVKQREILLNKVPRPHQLVMSATPIPRTLALTLFIGSDISVMKELPKGRLPVKTYWITRKKQKEVFNHIKEKLVNGEQAYIVFPVIEETEKIDLLAAKKEYGRLSNDIFKKFSVGLVHGKLSRNERESVMLAFKRGEIQVLVATSVIEVGLDQPNATILIIENAERFGLAQLHQLRGRIGRGTLASECFLFGEPKTEDGQKRLRLFTKLQDGFKIAEEDLKLRGPGDLWGTRQTGEPSFKLAHPILDEEILHITRDFAEETIRAHFKQESLNLDFGVQKYLEQSLKSY